MTTRVPGALAGPRATADRAAALPAWRRVLAVVAHPDDESFALGALLDRFVGTGAEVSVLCLTRGEASTLGADADDLAAVRDAELRAAAAALGLGRTRLLAHPDGGLSAPGLAERLTADVARELETLAPDGLVVFDPRAGVTGHPDHEAASLAALAAAAAAGLPVLGWALPASVAGALNEEYGANKALTPGARRQLRLYQWPGNVRELSNTIRRAYIMATQDIDESHLMLPIDLDARPGGAAADAPVLSDGAGGRPVTAGVGAEKVC